MSGKFVFIPDDHKHVAFEVSLEDILRLADPMKIPNLSCEALEQVFGGVGWSSRYGDFSTTCYVIKVFPELEEENNTWEPMVHFTFASGVAKELSMAEFLFEYYPVAKDDNHKGLLS